MERMGHLPKVIPNQDSLPRLTTSPHDKPHERVAKRTSDVQSSERGLLLSALARVSPAMAITLGTMLNRKSVNTIRNDDERVGRNEPCPCGCGAKAKNCPNR